MEAAAAVTPPEWWWPGLLIQLGTFLLLIAGLGWLLMRWGQREVDKLDRDILLIHATQQAFERDLRARLWEDPGSEDGTDDDGGGGGPGSATVDQAEGDDGNDHPHLG